MLSRVDLPEPDGPEQADEGAFVEGQRHVPERVHLDLAHAVDLRQVADVEQRGHESRRSSLYRNPVVSPDIRRRPARRLHSRLHRISTGSGVHWVGFEWKDNPSWRPGPWKELPIRGWTYTIATEPPKFGVDLSSTRFRIAWPLCTDASTRSSSGQLMELLSLPAKDQIRHANCRLLARMQKDWGCLLHKCVHWGVVFSAVLALAVPAATQTSGGNNAARANAYDDTWQDGPNGWVENARAILAGGDQTPGMVLWVGDSLTRHTAMGAWAQRGEGKTAEDQMITSWLHAGESPQSVSSIDGFALAAPYFCSARSYTVGDSLGAWHFMGTGMPVDTNPVTARQKLQDCATYPNR